MKTIVTTFAFTVAALAVASASHLNNGARTSPAQIIQMGGAPLPCGLPGLPNCPWQQETQAKKK